MASFWGKSTKKTEEKHGAESWMDSAPLSSSSLCPMRRTWTLHVVVVSFESSVGLKRRRLVGGFQAWAMGSFAPISYLPRLSSNRRLIRTAPVVFESPPCVRIAALLVSPLSFSSHPTRLALLPPPAAARLVPPRPHLAPASPCHLAVRRLVVSPFRLPLISPLRLLLVSPLRFLLISRHPSSSSLSSSFSPSSSPFPLVFVAVSRLIRVTLHLVAPHRHFFGHRCVILWIRLSSTSSLQPLSLSVSRRILRRTRLTRPHPFGKGRGGLGCNLACEGAEGVLKEPTSLIRGEGPGAVLTCEVGGVEGEGEGVVVVEE